MLVLALALGLAVLAPIAARLVEITRNPLGLAGALEKIDGDPRLVAITNRATAHLYIANSIKRVSGDGLFDTHPPTEKRIAILRAMAGKELPASDPTLDKSVAPL